MRSPPLISVSILIWNSKKHLHVCLDKLVTQILSNFEVILVDNGSDDQPLSRLHEKYPSLNLKTRRLNSNLGFAAANNIGARLAHGKWLALLNIDAYPEPE